MAGETASPEVIEAKLAASYVDPRAVQWHKALSSILVAGFFAAVLMLVPLGAFGLGMLAAGFLCVVLYRRRNPIADPTPGAGARLGAATGITGFAFFGILTAIEVMVFHSGPELRAALLQQVQESASRATDPQAQQMFEYLKSPPGLALIMTMGLIVMFVLFLIFASLGGAIGAYLLRRRPHT
jgi:hypothetical protein